MIEQFFSELTFWHWLVLGLVMFGIEMMTGTFDMLMIAIAAWATSAFTGFAPPELTPVGGQLIFFGIATVILFVFGRTVLSRLRKEVAEHPTLNKRMTGLVGQRGKATGDFEAGTGQVSIGDTVWSAQAADGEIVREGDAIVVESTRSNQAVVRRA